MRFNTAFGSDNSRGGGIYINKSSDIYIYNCTFTANTSNAGAGIYSDGQSKLKLSKSNINNNTGTGISVVSSEIKIDDTVIEGNSKHGIIINSATATISRAIIKYNGTNNIHAMGGNIYIDNSLIIDTRAGISIYSQQGYLNMYFCTVVQEDNSFNEKNINFRSLWVHWKKFIRLSIKF